jgi:hypothetical protein
MTRCGTLLATYVIFYVVEKIWFIARTVFSSVFFSVTSTNFLQGCGMFCMDKTD